MTVVTRLYSVLYFAQTQPASEGRYRNTLDAAQTIYRTEGLSAFYRGLFPSLLGILHVAVQFPLYEKLKIWASECWHSRIYANIQYLTETQEETRSIR